MSIERIKRSTFWRFHRTDIG